MPNLSMSNLGVRQSSISISQLLQLPVERWNTQGDLSSAFNLRLML